MLLKKQIEFWSILLLGILLVGLSVQQLSLAELWETIANGNFWMVLPVYCVSIFGYYIRSLRWQKLLAGIDATLPVGALYASLSIGYAVNLATPRLGEIARCMVLKRTHQIPVEVSLISVVLERLIDIFCLFLLLMLAIGLNIQETSSFLQSNMLIPFVNRFQQMNMFYLIPLGVTVILALWLLLKLTQKYQKWNLFLTNLRKSFFQLIHLKQKGLFLFYTILIWGCYFLMTYLWFFTFPETSHFNLQQAFVIMVVGSIGRSVPIQGGGMGAYHFLVSNTLALFGCTLILGNALAFIIHGAQLILTFVLGSISWIWMLTFLKRTK